MKKLKNISDDSTADSDQQDAEITDLDFRSTRQHEATDTAATEQHEHKMKDADLRSARLSEHTNSAEAEHPAENTADADLKSTRPPQTPDSKNDEMAFQSPSNAGNSDFSNFGENDTIVPHVLDN